MQTSFDGILVYFISRRLSNEYARTFMAKPPFLGWDLEPMVFGLDHSVYAEVVCISFWQRQ